MPDLPLSYILINLTGWPQLEENEVDSIELFLSEGEPFEDLTSSEIHALYAPFCAQRGIPSKNSIHMARAFAPHIEDGILQKRTLHGHSVYSRVAV